MRTFKDKKKFGKDKIPKNRNCKKFGYSIGDKEYRKNARKQLNKINDDKLHQRFNITKAY